MHGGQVRGQIVRRIEQAAVTRLALVGTQRASDVFRAHGQDLRRMARMAGLLSTASALSRMTVAALAHPQRGQVNVTPIMVPVGPVRTSRVYVPSCQESIRATP